MSKLHYTPDLAGKFIALLRQLNIMQNEFVRRQAGLIEQVVGRKIDICKVCGRIMIPRRLWDMIRTVDMDCPNFIIGRGTKGYCLAHQGRGKPRQMSPETVSHFRNLYAVDLDRDYDKEEQAT